MDDRVDGDGHSEYDSSMETSLWVWLLFKAGIKTFEAKQLLTQLAQQEMTLEALLRTPVNQISSMELTTLKSRLPESPSLLDFPPAIRWNEPLYPQGLHDLVLKQKPALLFYCGSKDLLSRPIISLESGELTPQTADLWMSIIEILLGENLLPAVFTHSQQEELLLELMSVSDGEALIYIDQGLQQYQPTDTITRYLGDGRLVILSPMPPMVNSNPALTPIIQRIAAASATRWIVSTSYTGNPAYNGLQRPVLQLQAEDAAGMAMVPGAVGAVDIADAITWLQDTIIPGAVQNTSTNEQSIIEVTPSQEIELPPVSTEEALKILELGGTVPEALRQRLVGRNNDTG